MPASSWKNIPSPSAALKAQLDHPVIDTDLHTIEFGPLLEDYIHKYGGSAVVDRFRKGLQRGSGYVANDWYDQTPEQRLARRSARPPWWALPTKNTLDLATVSIPRLLHERLAEQGTDFAVLYPNVTTLAATVGDENLRRPLARAVNHYHADVYKAYADRLAPVAAIPLHTPQEGIEELEFAVRTLGLKTVLIPGAIRRPVAEAAEQYPAKHHPTVARYAFWVDTFGVDSLYDYDPFWAKVVALGVAPTTHSGSQGWTSRATVSNYMYNHIGHFADASEALAKSLFFSGVTRRFPELRVGFLEGGAAWAANVYADLVGHWEKRGGEHVQNYNPEAIDGEQLEELWRAYGADVIGERQLKREDLVGGALGTSNNSRRQPQEPGALDDFAAAGITRIEDIRDRFVPNFFFGAEADDPTVAHAFNTRVNPLGVKLNAFWASDSGHWDVPDLTRTLSDTWALVERGALTRADFRDLVFTNPYKFYTEANPEFFAGTAVAARLGASARPAATAKDKRAGAAA